MRDRSTRTVVAGALMLAVAFGSTVAGGGVARASASTLECGQASLERQVDLTAGFIVHSCTGEGTVLYTVGQVGVPSFQVSHHFSWPGASIRKPVNSDPNGSPPLTSVSWEQK